MLTVAALSALLALPFLLPLALRYRLHMVNLVPGRLVGLGGRDMVRALLSPRFAFALLGFLVIRRGRWTPADGAAPPPASASVLMALVAVTGVLVAYAVVAQALEPHGIVLPLFAPGLHFHLYLTAFECLLFGVGLWAAARWYAEYLATTRRLRAERRPAAARVIAAIAVAMMITAAIPAYRRRADVTLWPARAREWGADAELASLYRWARQHARATDVFLADDHWGMFGVVAAGRQVVALDDAMSNPYVSRIDRARARDAMFAALRAGDRRAFRALAKRHGVTHVVSVPQTVDDCCSVSEAQMQGLPLVHHEGTLRIYAVADDVAAPPARTATDAEQR